MKEQLIKELKRLQQDLIDRFDNEEADVVYDANEAIQSLQPKEQVNQEIVKLPLSGESKLSAEEVLSKIQGIMYYNGFDWINKIDVLRAMHDFANNSEAMKENAIGFFKSQLNEEDWDDERDSKAYDIYLTNKEK